MAKYKFYDNGNKVIAVSSYAGRPVRGIAKCDPRDFFDKEKGMRLAEARCNLKVAEKRAARSEDQYEAAIVAVRQAERRLDNMKDYFDESHAKLAMAKAHLEGILSTM